MISEHVWESCWDLLLGTKLLNEDGLELGQEDGLVASNALLELGCKCGVLADGASHKDADTLSGLAVQLGRASHETNVCHLYLHAPNRLQKNNQSINQSVSQSCVHQHVPTARACHCSLLSAALEKSCSVWQSKLALPHRPLEIVKTTTPLTSLVEPARRRPWWRDRPLSSDRICFQSDSPKHKGTSACVPSGAQRNTLDTSSLAYLLYGT